MSNNHIHLNIHSVSTFTTIKLILLLTVFNACRDIHNNHKKIVHSNKTHHIPDVFAPTDLTSVFYFLNFHTLFLISSLLF